MTPHRLYAKYYVTDPDAVDLPALVPVFHRWIQERRVDALLIDVVDYKHVHEGPGIILIGHEADYGLDLGRGRPGLRYSRKRGHDGDLREALRTVLRQALFGCYLLETEPALHIRFRTDEVEVAFLDRLHLPNQAASIALVQGALEDVLAELYGDVTVSLTRLDEDLRQPLALHARIPEAVDVATLLARLYPETAHDYVG